MLKHVKKIPQQQEMMWNEVANILKNFIERYHISVELNNTNFFIKFANQLLYEPHYENVLKIEAIINNALINNKATLIAKTKPITADIDVLQALYTLQHRLSDTNFIHDQANNTAEFSIVYLKAPQSVTISENKVKCFVLQIQVENNSGITLFKPLMTPIVVDEKRDSQFKMLCHSALSNTQQISGVMLDVKQLRALFVDLKTHKDVLVLFEDQNSESESKKKQKSDRIEYLTTLSQINKANLLKFIKIY